MVLILVAFSRYSMLSRSSTTSESHLEVILDRSRRPKAPVAGDRGGPEIPAGPPCHHTGAYLSSQSQSRLQSCLRGEPCRLLISDNR
jgi:hypothetical protein